MQALPLLQQSVAALLYIRVMNAGVYRANIGTPGRIMRADALSALAGVDLIDRLTLGNCLVGTLWFTGSATDTLVCDLVRHGIYLLRNQGIVPPSPSVMHLIPEFLYESLSHMRRYKAINITTQTSNLFKQTGA